MGDLFLSFSNNFVSVIFVYFGIEFTRSIYFSLFISYSLVHFGIFFYEILFCIFFLLFSLQNIYIIIVYF